MECDNHKLSYLRLSTVYHNCSKPKQEGREKMSTKMKQGFVLAGLLLVELLASIDITGVTVLVPTLRTYFNLPEELAGWVLMAYLIPFSLFMVPIGWMADKTGQPERIIAGAILGFSICSLLCALAPNGLALIAFRALKGVCAAGVFTTEFVIIIKYWQNPRRTVELVITGLALGVLVGPIAGAVFAGHWRYFFLIGTVLALLSFVGLSQVRKLTPVKRQADEADLHHARFLDKLKYLAGLIFWGALLNFVMAVTSQGVNLVITLHLQDHLGKSPIYNGLVLSVIAAGMLFSNAIGLGSKLIKNTQVAAWGSAMAFAATMILLSFTDWTGLIAWVVYGLMGIFLGVTLSTVELMTLMPLKTENLSVGNGIVIAAMQTGFAISALTPILYARLGTNSVYVLSALIVGTLVSFVLAQIRRCQRIDTP